MAKTELMRMNIIVDEDGWVNWVFVNDDGRGEIMSGNDPMDEFCENLKEWKDGFYAAIENRKDKK